MWLNTKVQMNKKSCHFGCLLFIITHALSLWRNLAAIQDREICCYSISCKEKDNIGELQFKTLGLSHVNSEVVWFDSGSNNLASSLRCKYILWTVSGSFWLWVFSPPPDITLQWLIQHSKSRRSWKCSGDGVCHVTSCPTLIILCWCTDSSLCCTLHCPVFVCFL